MSQKNQILIITYYWPPSGGSGVQRWLKFVKYFPQSGIIPVVFTPANPYFDLKDPSLLNDVPKQAEVLHFPIWEPYRFLDWLSFFFRGKKTEVKNLLKAPSGFFGFIRANFFIPDPRIFWVRPSVRFLMDFIKEHQIQTIITTGPPHSIHLIGLRLKKRISHLNWLVDFRDPWTTWGFLLGMRPTGISMRIHHRLETQVLKCADVITTVSPFYANQLNQISKKEIQVFTNGFDEEDFNNLRFDLMTKFIIRHVGVLHPACDVRPFFMALKNWLNERQIVNDLRIHFTGQINETIQYLVKSDQMLRDLIVFEQPVEHTDLIKLYGKTSAVLLILSGYKDAEGFLPGKLFEYLATGLPIVAVGPSQGDAAKVIADAGAGKMADTHNQAAIFESLDQAYDKWKNKVIPTPLPSSSLKYSRRMISKKMADLLNDLQSKNSSS